jgi:hypothetical protein
VKRLDFAPKRGKIQLEDQSSVIFGGFTAKNHAKKISLALEGGAAFEMAPKFRRFVG